MATDITIVVPVYNVKEYLRDCLAALPDEACIVLVNDGSNDGSEDICTEYSQNHTNVKLINKENGGLSDARNAGMEHVATPFVFFLDADDRIDGRALLRALDYAKKNNLDWLQCGYVYDYNDYLLEYKSSNAQRLMTRTEVMETLVRNGIIKNFAWGKIYRTSIIKGYQFPKGKFFEDSFWQYKIIHVSDRFGYFPDRVTYYRCRQGSISGNFSMRNLDLLAGLRERTDFIINNYSELSSAAALCLWQTAWDFLQLSKGTEKQVQTAYSSVYKEIKEKYAEEITSGIDTRPLLYRMADKSAYQNNRIKYSIIRLLIRIVERYRPSDFVIIKKTC